MDLLEAALKERAESESGAATLLAQWTFDRQLIGVALQSVQMTFGHFSRHDESHSRTILVQIERILGADRIKALSATDLWLLLEAAYSHDIGMVVPDADARQWWSSKEFREHLAEMREHTDPDYRAAATLLAATGHENPPGDWPFEVKRALTLAVSEYARRRHPSRAARIAEKPGTIGLDSPRTLIPRRLFSLLGKICELHGGTFEQAAALVHAEQGMSRDDAHPRFVAFMLRMGDLLDLDDGRFCPAMRAVFGHLPGSSAAHVRKHASITHLLVNTRTIEVDARCDAGDESAYDATETWFAWLRDEASKLAAQWAEISPFPALGPFPSLGRVEVQMARQVRFPDGTRPRFEIDRESVLDLVRGTSLYSNKFECVRELLQNAVDATVMRTWREHEGAILEIDRQTREEGANPISEVGKIVANFEIDVRVDDTPNESGGSSRVKFRVTDRGSGVSLDSLRYLQRVGASSRNPERIRARRNMPEWLHPSGTFGVGLQSVFLESDRVVLTTKATDDRIVREIHLRRGAEGVSGGITASELDEETNNHPENRLLRLRGGTRVEFEADVALIPSTIARSGADRETSVVLSDFDPVASQRLSYDVAVLRDLVRQYAHHSIVPIRLNGQECPRAVRFPPGEGIAMFDPETQVDLRLHASTRAQSVGTYYYRGAPTDERDNFQWLEVTADLYFGKASDVLRMSREKFSSTGRELVNRRVHLTMVKLLSKYAERVASTPESDEAIAVSMACLLHHDVDLQKVGRELGGWRSFRVDDNDGAPMLGATVDVPTLRIVVREDYQGREPRPGTTWDADSNTLTFLNQPEMAGWVLTALRRVGRNLGLVDAGRDVRSGRATEQLTYQASAAPTAALTEAALPYLVRHRHIARVGGRVTLPCLPEFSKLAIEEHAIERTWIDPVKGFIRPRMVSPLFTVTAPNGGRSLEPKNLVELVRWVAPRTIERLSERETAELYQAFMEVLVRLMPGDGVLRVNPQETLMLLRSAFGVRAGGA